MGTLAESELHGLKYIALKNNEFSELKLPEFDSRAKKLGVYSEVFAKLDLLNPELQKRTIFIQVDPKLKTKFTIEHVLDFLKANGVPTVINIRKRTSKQQKRFFNLLRRSSILHRESQVYEIKLDQMKKSIKSQAKLCMRNKSSLQMTNWFIELPTEQCVEKIMLAVRDRANYFTDRYIDIWRAGTSSYFETDHYMFKTAYQNEQNLRLLKRSTKSSLVLSYR